MPAKKKTKVKKKAAARKKPAAKKKSPAKKGVKASSASRAAAKPIGRVTHYYGAIRVAVAKFSKTTKLGASVHFHGATTDFVQVLTSAQYDHKPVAKIPKNKQVGIKVRSRVREGDAILTA